MKHNSIFIFIFLLLFTAGARAEANYEQNDMESFKAAYEESQTYEENIKARQEAQILKEKKFREEAINKERARNEKYQDKLREIQIKDLEMNLDFKHAQVKRANDYIDKQLEKPEEKIAFSIIKMEQMKLIFFLVVVLSFFVLGFFLVMAFVRRKKNQNTYPPEKQDKFNLPNL